MDNEKKNKEYQLLNKIYNSEKIRIEKSESPDFIIHTKTSEFGVEITRFYYSETSARLKNMNEYIANILRSDTNNVLDKRDKGLIVKAKVYMKSSNEDAYKYLGETVTFKYNDSYIPFQNPKFEDIENRVLEIINKKTKKSKKYKKRIRIYRVIYR